MFALRTKPLEKPPKPLEKLPDEKLPEEKLPEEKLPEDKLPDEKLPVDCVPLELESHWLAFTQTQVPFWQIWFAPHMCPQEPQLLLSLLRSVQVPLQQVLPEGQGQVALQAGAGGHAVTHWPFWQTRPEAQQTLLQQTFEQQCASLEQLWPGSLHLAKAVPMPLRPRMPPMALAAMVLRA